MSEHVAFTDPAGGSGGDSMTLAIAHAEERDGRTVAVLDAIRERRPPFSPEQVVEEFAALLRLYRVGRVVGDRYAGSWPAEQFRKRGVEYEPSERTKSDIYRDVLPLLNSGGVELLDDARLLAQLAGLERRTARGGKDSVDHAPSSHDDLANAAAGALVLAAGEGAELPLLLIGSPGYYQWVAQHGGDRDEAPEPASEPEAPEPEPAQPGLVASLAAKAGERWSAITARSRAVAQAVATPAAKVVAAAERAKAHHEKFSAMSEQELEDFYRQRARRTASAKWLERVVRERGAYMPGDWR